MLMPAFACNNKSMPHEWTQGDEGQNWGGGLVAWGRIGQLIGSMGLVWREACNRVQRATAPNKVFLGFNPLLLCAVYFVSYCIFFLSSAG
jgi:hypothetical protein